MSLFWTCFKFTINVEVAYAVFYCSGCYICRVLRRYSACGDISGPLDEFKAVGDGGKNNKANRKWKKYTPTSIVNALSYTSSTSTPSTAKASTAQTNTKQCCKRLDKQRPYTIAQWQTIRPLVARQGLLACSTTGIQRAPHTTAAAVPHMLTYDKAHCHSILLQIRSMKQRTLQKLHCCTQYSQR